MQSTAHRPLAGPLSLREIRMRSAVLLNARLSISLVAAVLLLAAAIAPFGLLAGPSAEVQAAAAVPAACNAAYNPDFKASNFKGTNGKPFEIENTYFPLEPGTTYIYEGTIDDERERTVTRVTNRTKLIQGVRAVEVHDQVFTDLDGDGDLDLAEDTLDWYAQDKQGNVWYLGEDTREFDEDGKVISTDGTWLTGVDGAKPGIIMKADPKVGTIYRQEFFEDEAEDMARVVHLNRSVKVPFGSFNKVLQTEEWACHDPGAPHEDKYYAREVGNIKVKARDGSGTSELIKVLGGDDRSGNRVSGDNESGDDDSGDNESDDDESEDNDSDD
jgi:hypothetical protein